MPGSDLGLARLAFAFAASALIAGCGGSGPGGAPAPAVEDEFSDHELPDTILVDVAGRPIAPDLTLAVAKRPLMPCVKGTGDLDSVTIDPNDPPQPDTVRLNAGGHSLAIPVASLDPSVGTVRFRLRDVANGKYLLVNAQVSPGNALRDSVFLTLDYGRCDFQGDPADLSVVRIKYTLPGEELGGTHLPGTTRIRKGLRRLSDYALSMP